MEEYFDKRENLDGVIMLVDARHPDMEIDNGAYEWFISISVPVFLVMTKCDKLGSSALKSAETAMRGRYKAACGFVRYSVNSLRSRDDFWRTFSSWAEKLDKE
jgi:GTP-binding protein